MCLTGAMPYEVLDVCFNVFHSEFSILSNEVSWGSCRIRNKYDVRSCFHPTLFLFPLCRLSIKHIDEYWFSVKELWEFEDRSFKEFDACGWCVIYWDRHIGLFRSKGKRDDWWYVRFCIDSSSSCWNCYYSASLGEVMVDVDEEIDLVDFAILSIVDLESWI